MKQHITGKRMFLAGACAVVFAALAAPAAAQTVTIEGGYARVGVAVDTGFGVTVSRSVGGGYGGLSATVPAAPWIQPFFAANAISQGGGGLYQGGANLRIGPAEWLAKPVARGGVAFSEGSARPSGGVGVYVGREAGAVFTIDWTSYEGAGFAIMHFGGFYSF